jgi:biotin synthase
MTDKDWGALTDDELLHYITTEDKAEAEELFAAARKVREEHYGLDVYFRGLIEFTNYCKNDCFYCGIRGSNTKTERYRLSAGQILECCRMGNELGFRTFVLQGGEDPWFTDERFCDLVRAIHAEFPLHAITLSAGERSRESYEKLYNAGASRYLLRHESAYDAHYAALHPPAMLLSERKKCLYNLKEIGFQTGAGFMVGTPFQTPKCLLADLRFLQELKPHMVGIGPFIPAANTPFAAYNAGGVELTLRMVALTRLLLPAVLLPATTALGALAGSGTLSGREQALMAGANVIMPNISPPDAQRRYTIYDNKPKPGEKITEYFSALKQSVEEAGFVPKMGTRGDSKVS